MSSVFISRAVPADLPACVALLPLVAGYDSAFFVARDAAGLLLGAAGIGWQSWGDPPGFPMWVYVLADRRRQGIGRRLAAAASALACGEAPALWAAMPLDLAGDAAAFAGNVGFTVAQRQLYFRADAARFLLAMEGIVARLRRHGRIPQGARTMALSASNAEEVAALIQREVRNAPHDVLAIVHQALAREPASAPVDVTRSTVLVLDDRIVGALLSRRMPDGRNSRIVSNAVSPHLRRGWANVVLLEATTRLGVMDDCVWFDFDCAEDVQDTIGLARRGEADLVRTNGLFYQAVATLPA